RTAVFCLLPFSCPSGSLQLVFGDALSTRQLIFYLANLNSFVFDFFARQKVSGSHLTASILRQLPLVSWEGARALHPKLADGVVNAVMSLTVDIYPPFAQMVTEMPEAAELMIHLDN